MENLHCRERGFLSSKSFQWTCILCGEFLYLCVHTWQQRGLSISRRSWRISLHVDSLQSPAGPLSRNSRPVRRSWFLVLRAGKNRLNHSQGSDGGGAFKRPAEIHPDVHRWKFKSSQILSIFSSLLDLPFLPHPVPLMLNKHTLPT